MAQQVAVGRSTVPSTRTPVVVVRLTTKVAPGLDRVNRDFNSKPSLSVCVRPTSTVLSYCHWWCNLGWRSWKAGKMAPCPHLSSGAPRCLVPFALRTSGCNSTTDQGSDSAPVQTIAFTVIDRLCNGTSDETAVEELDVNSLGLQAALQKVRVLIENSSSQ